jgi:signal transduction histidine kinase
VAHDLRDALSGIAGLAELAHVALDEHQDCGSALRWLSLIGEQARRSNQMLEGLLRLAQTRDAALQIGPVDVQAMVEQVAQEVRLCHGMERMPQMCARPIPPSQQTPTCFTPCSST